MGEPLDDPYELLNERFYAADPAEYLSVRLAALVTVAGARDSWRDTLRSGAAVEGFEVQLKDPPDDDALDRYVVVDAESLLFLASETTIRLFLAHDTASPCPWLELSSERAFGKFKERVRREVVEAESSELSRRAAWVVQGRRRDSGSHLSEAAANTAAFVKRLAEHWLDNANAHNALKHGLAANAGNAILQLGDNENAMLRVGDGPSLEHLESTPWESGQRAWSLKTRWIDVEESLALTFIAIRIIESLWRVARARYVGGDTTVEVFTPSDLRTSDLRTDRTSPAKSMSWTVMHETRST